VVTGTKERVSNGLLVRFGQQGAAETFGWIGSNIQPNTMRTSDDYRINDAGYTRFLDEATG
jgi:hypothetical protein